MDTGGKLMTLIYDADVTNGDGKYRIVRRYFGDDTDDVLGHGNAVELPDDEFPTPNRVAQGNVKQGVLDRINDNWPDPPGRDDPPWAHDHGLDDDETRIPRYYWDADAKHVVQETEVVKTEREDDEAGEGD